MKNISQVCWVVAAAIALASSALTANADDEISVSTINASTTTAYGGINITSGVFVTGGILTAGTTDAGSPIYFRGGYGGSFTTPDPINAPVVMRLSTNPNGSGNQPVTLLLEDESDFDNSFAIEVGFGGFDLSPYFAQFPSNAFEFPLDLFMTTEDFSLQAPKTITLNEANFYPNGSSSESTTIALAKSSITFSAQETNGVTQSTASLQLNSHGVTAVGNVSVVGNFTVTGTKSFAHPDPRNPGKEILFYTLEGPEYGTYTRGTGQLKNGEVQIKLSEAFTKVTSQKALITAQVSPLDDCRGLMVIQKTSGQITVHEMSGGKSNAHFDWFVQGVRAGYDEVPGWRYTVPMENVKVPVPARPAKHRKHGHPR